MPTASRMPLLMACLGSEVLPTVGRLHSASDRGTAIHRYLEEVVRYGRMAALGNVGDDHRAECERIDVTRIQELANEGAEPEQAFAWSPSTDRGRALASTGRSYSDVANDEIAGTADLVCRDRVIDYKTGRYDVEPPEQNGQMKTLALSVARARGLESVIAEVWKLRDDGGWWVRSHTFDSFDLDAIAADIRQRLAQLDDVRAGRHRMQLVEGDHCQWCPSLTACPAKTALAKSLASVTKGIDDATALAPEERGLAWDVITRAQQVIDRARASLEELAKREPIPLPDGRTLALEESTREYVVGEVVRDVVRERYGDEVAAKVCEVKVSSSKAALDRELGKASREVKDEIRRRGGVKVVRSTRLKAS